MIYVNEIKPPIKLSGLTSFLVKSDKFNPNLKEIINGLQVVYEHRKNKILQYYEISIADLKNFLDDAIKTDDIKLELAINTKEQAIIQKVTQDEIDNLNFKPYQHQIDAFNYGIEHKNWLLLDSMGLGKTLEIIGLAEILKTRGLIDHCFIICGVNSVKENWAAEIEKFGNSSCMILGKKIGKRGGISYASVAECCQILKKPIEEFFIITNIEKLRDESIIKAINSSKNNFGMIAVDEIHRCSNKQSKQGANLLKLQAPYMVGATGTLITNTPISAYLPLVWTKNDHSILTTFRPQYYIYNPDNQYETIGYKNLDILKEELNSCSLRRTLDEVRSDMPKKIIEYEEMEMEKDHWNFYKGIKYQIAEEISKVDKINLSRNGLLSQLIRLRQAIVCPSILTSESITPSKLIRCCELVGELVEQGEKVVILSNFVQPIHELKKMLAKYNPLTILGEDKPEIRKEANKKFQEDENCKIIMGTHQAAGTGLTLNAAMYMIMLDTPYTYSTLSQSCDRIYRINNTRPAYIKILNCKYTVDEKIKEIVDTKRELGEFFEGKEVKNSQELKEELYNMLNELE